MCRCTDWMGRSISMSPSFCDARTRRGAVSLDGSRRRFFAGFTMNWRDAYVRTLDSSASAPIRSRKPEPKTWFSGSGQVVR